MGLDALLKPFLRPPRSGKARTARSLSRRARHKSRRHSPFPVTPAKIRGLAGRCSHQFVLDFTQEGILRKDDLFKVVFDPGADKREKRIPARSFRVLPRTSCACCFLRI